MKPDQYLPSVMIIISIASALLYGYNGDARHFIYWLSAAALTASVTF